VRAMLVWTSNEADNTETRSLMAFIIPARSHAEVIIAAVAARDKSKAEAHAKRYDIPIVHESYDCKSLSHSPVALSPDRQVPMLIVTRHSTHQ
jgi:hypothetical protein